jgi:RimJ/RimL family protein N-acetyltransferase
MTFITLQTPRLIVRQFTMDDLHFQHTLAQESFNSTDTLEDTQRWLEWTLRSYREYARLYQPPYGDYVVTLLDSTPIGTVGLVPALVPWGVFDETLPPDSRALVTPEFGLFWSMRAAVRGQGYAVEAARAVIDYLFTVILARRVIATTDHDNAASIRVMQKLGMTIQANPHPEPSWFQVVGVLEQQAALNP